MLLQGKLLHVPGARLLFSAYPWKTEKLYIFAFVQQPGERVFLFNVNVWLLQFQVVHRNQVRNGDADRLTVARKRKDCPSSYCEQNKTLPRR